MLICKAFSDLMNVRPIDRCVTIKSRLHIRLKCRSSGLRYGQCIALISILGMTEDLKLDGLSKLEKQERSAFKWITQPFNVRNGPA